MVPRSTEPAWVPLGRENCIICVYKRRAVGNCKQGPHQSRSDEKFTKFHRTQGWKSGVRVLVFEEGETWGAVQFVLMGLEVEGWNSGWRTSAVSTQPT